MPPSANSASLTRKLAQIWPYALPIIALSFAVAMHGFAAANPHSALREELAIIICAVVLLVPSVLAALHHADSAARRLGEPYGTLLLTLSVTTIEVSIIVSMMLNGTGNPTLAREAVFSAVMLVCSGGVGFCLMLGALRHGEQEHNMPVSYTHLDVYKRQALGDALATGEVFLRMIPLLAAHGVRTLGDAREAAKRIYDKDCLLYTSRCV